MERSFRFDWQEVVKELVKTRKKQRLTQEELAALAEVSKPTLNRFEQGYTNITVDNVLKILNCLGLSKSAPCVQKKKK